MGMVRQDKGNVIWCFKLSNELRFLNMRNKKGSFTLERE